MASVAKQNNVTLVWIPGHSGYEGNEAADALAREAAASKFIGPLASVAKQNNVTLVWIPGHSGYEGNEAADSLAREAAASKFIGPEPVLGISFSTAKEALSKWEHEQIAHNWREDNYFPVITIKNGKVRGAMGKTVDKQKPYYSFRGIPYAQPPVGELRFRAPLEAKNWNNILDATKDGIGCVQGTKSVIGSENCLYINVYTPSFTERNQTVMVFIHGGTFAHQNSTYKLYGPDYFLEKDVVFVSFNYRLGVFGYLSTADMACPGNWGLKDQLLALNWVQENVHYFGGSPEKVTLFGQSAGAVSVSYLLQTKKATGLFRAAIMQSGVSLCLWGLNRYPRLAAFEIGKELKIITNSSQDLVQQLRRIDYETLQVVADKTAASVAENTTLAGTVSFSVVKEPTHEGALFDGMSHELLRNGDFLKVPIIIGFNSNEVVFEANIFETLIGRILVTVKFDRMKSFLTPADMTRNETIRLKVGRFLHYYYYGVAPAAAHRRTTVKFLSNDQFVRPIREAVIQASKYTRVYFYEFSHSGLLDYHKDQHIPGVGHAYELNYLFRHDVNVTLPRDEIRTREQMVTMWTNFAKFRQPIRRKEKLFGGVIWPAATKDNLVYLNVGNYSLSVKKNPEKTDMDLYDGLYCAYGEPPYDTY